MNEALRRSSAHVLTFDLNAPLLGHEVSHHLQRVLRLRSGETVTITDGKGNWRECHWTGETVEVAGEVQVSAERDKLVVAVTIPKGDRLEWMVQKLVEIGVDRVQLLAADRSVVRWDDRRTQKHLERLRRVVESAIGQSRRVWNCEILAPVSTHEVLSGMAIAEPGGRSIRQGDVAVAVGPEGGWSDAEIAVASESVSLSEQILRVETAAVVGATLMAAHRS
jgi:16S rRNA (uracil1498-N3)-methyltransferase